MKALIECYGRLFFAIFTQEKCILYFSYLRRSCPFRILIDILTFQEKRQQKRLCESALLRPIEKSKHTRIYLECFIICDKVYVTKSGDKNEGTIRKEQKHDRRQTLNNDYKYV